MITVVRYSRLALIVFLVFCSAPLSSQKISHQDKRAAEDDICEAVIRSQMEGWYQEGDQGEKEAKDATDKAIAQQLNFKIFFVEIDGKDPNEAFIQRFHDIPRVIKKVSESEITKEFRMAVVDKETGQRGIIFRVEQIRWLGKNSVTVEGGYHCDGLCAAGITYKLKRVRGKWVIKSHRMNWIS